MRIVVVAGAASGSSFPSGARDAKQLDLVQQLQAVLDLAAALARLEGAMMIASGCQRRKVGSGGGRTDISKDR